MQIGQTLREARLKQGLDLYEVKRVTKVSVPDLRALEEDRWDDVRAPEPRALLEVYASFLGLDTEALLAEPGRRQPPGGRHRRSVLLAIGFAAAVGLIIGLIGLGSLGGSGGGGGSGGPTEVVTQTTTTPAPSSPVSVQITTHALVWVCLIDQRERPVINGLNLARDQTVGPYSGKAFDVAFGNGKVDVTVNGSPVDVPDIAEPFGYRITPKGATRLAPSDEPTCT
jgi:transcriptional regulator with XRE-family HTH domain